MQTASPAHIDSEPSKYIIHKTTIFPESISVYRFLSPVLI